MGVQGFLFAWVLNFMLMMFVLMFTETLKSKGTADYYKEKKWEQKGKIYEQLGIHYFRKLLVMVGWEKLNKKANPVKNSLAALVHLEYRTKQSELGHLIIFIIVGGFSIYVAIRYSFSASAWLIFLNLVLNFYPILLQRYNRPRLQKAIQIYQQKQSAKVIA
jgi:hypothetical protein